MDLKSLKLELLERIALLDDEARLLALKRLLDAPRGYGIPNENLNVVKEGEGAYLKVEDRTYTAQEVRDLLEQVRRSFELDDMELQLTPEEWAELEKERDAYLRGDGTYHTWKEVKERMRKDLEG